MVCLGSMREESRKDDSEIWLETRTWQEPSPVEMEMLLEVQVCWGNRDNRKLGLGLVNFEVPVSYPCGGVR